MKTYSGNLRQDYGGGCTFIGTLSSPRTDRTHDVELCAYLVRRLIRNERVKWVHLVVSGKKFKGSIRAKWDGMRVYAKPFGSWRWVYQSVADAAYRVGLDAGDTFYFKFTKGRK